MFTEIIEILKRSNSSLMADAVAEGLIERSGKATKAEGESAEQPMAAWEKELLENQAPEAKADEAAKAE